MLQNHGDTSFTETEINQYNRNRIKQRQQDNYKEKLHAAVCELEDSVGGGVFLNSDNKIVKRIAHQHDLNPKKLVKAYMSLCHSDVLLRNTEEDMGLPYGTLDVCMGSD